MATLVLYSFAVFQLNLLWKPSVVEGTNSSLSSFSNISIPTGGNGIHTQLVPSNMTQSTTSSILVNSTEILSTTRGLPGMTKNKTGARIDKDGIGKRSSGKSEHGVQTKEPNSTGIYAPNDRTDDKDGVPFWAYVIIAAGVVLLLIAVVVILYRRVDRWKKHGSYIVWDDELELSPAFTRESEFLLDNLAADQEPGTPELQIYEIPLDSLGQQRVYIGTKRVAPESDDRKEHMQAARFTKNKKHRRKHREDFRVNTLPAAGRRDHIYSSVNDEVNSALSEGDLHEGRNVSGHALPAVILSAQNLHKGDFLKPNTSGSSLDIKRDIRSLTLGSKTKSVSNLFQNRPLPPAPSKRFSKSLDRLRFLETGQFNKGKGKTFPFHQKPTPIRAHPVLVKSSSFGGTFNKIINASQPPILAPRKGSVDLLDKSATFDLGHVRKPNLCHRHSKSLDTLLLLRGLSWTAYDVDIYHSYASVHSNQSDNNNEKEPSYASVTSDEKHSSHDEASGRLSLQSKASTLSGGPIDSDDPDEDFTEENPYASVSEDEMTKTGSLQSGRDSRHSDRESNLRDSGAPSSTLESEDATSPYASVRISQIPGLVIRPSLGEGGNCSEEVFAQEDSGFTIGIGKDAREDEDLKRASTRTYLELLPGVGRGSIFSESETSSGCEKDEDLKRASIHTYLELIPDSGRESIISETSSGYARPIDVLSDVSEPLENKDIDAENRKSITDFEIPVGKSVTLDTTDKAYKSLEQSPEKKDNISLQMLSNNSVTPQEKGAESRTINIQSNPPLSQLSIEELQEDEGDANSGLEEARTLTDEHMYENSEFIQNLKHRNAFEQVKTINSDAVNAQTFYLQESRLTEEVRV